MSNTNEFYVHGRFIDKNYNDNDDKPIKFANSEYDMRIEADDMKKAYDIALEYMPAGSYITEISIGYHNHSNRIRTFA